MVCSLLGCLQTVHWPFAGALHGIVVALLCKLGFVWVGPWPCFAFFMVAGVSLDSLLSLVGVSLGRPHLHPGLVGPGGFALCVLFS